MQLRITGFYLKDHKRPVKDFIQECVESGLMVILAIGRLVKNYFFTYG